MNFITRFCATCGAETKFEKARMAATYQNTLPPQEQDVELVIRCLKGEDPETDSSIGFGSLVRRLKMSNNDEKGWILILKSLIIIDRYRLTKLRCVSQRVLVDEFLELDIPHVEFRQERNSQAKQLLIDQLIQKYYRYIKYKCYHFRKKNSLLVESKDRKLYFLQLNQREIMNELTIILEFVNRAFLIIDTSKHGHLQYKLIQQIFLAILQDLFKFYGLSIIALSNLLIMKESLQMDELLLIRDFTKQIYSFSNRLNGFIYSCRFIKEFQQVDLDYQVSSQLVEYLDSYIKTKFQTDYRSSSLFSKHQSEVSFRKSKRESTYQQPKAQSINGLKSQVQNLLKEKALNEFNEDLFDEFKNNFSLSYDPIDIKFHKVESVSVLQEDYLTQLNFANSKVQIEQIIVFKQPWDLDSESQAFKEFKNQYFL